MSSVYSPTSQSRYQTIPVRSAGIVPTPNSNSNFEKGGSLLTAMDLQRLPPYLVLGNILGFRERFSLVFFIVFGGALVGFVLARSQLLNPNSFRHQLTLGEAFWATREPWKGLLAAHIILCFCGGILVIWQFVPAIRRNYIGFHRFNGYLSLSILFPALLFGMIVARHAFGGDISDQAGFYCLGLLGGFYGVQGISNVHRDTRRHRRWMLRFVGLLGVAVTMKLIVLCANKIVTDIGSYYALWRCDELLFVTGGNLTAYPSCLAAQKAGTNLAHGLVAIHASTREAHINTASTRRVISGMAIWVALIIHMVGTEVYIRATEGANQHRLGFILGRPGMLPEERLESTDH